MVEPGRAAAAREAKKTSTTASTVAAMKKKLATTRPEKERAESRKPSSTEPESPSYRLALKSLFSCRNSHGHAPAPDCGGGGGRRSSSGKKLGCSASICKVKDNPSNGGGGGGHRVTGEQQPVAEEAGAAGGEAGKRRASVSGGSERRVKKPVSEASAPAAAAASKLAQGAGGSSVSSSSSSSSFRGMQLRRLSGCYECHMVVDPISGVFRDSASMRAAAICPCPDCGEIFVRQESLHLHQSIRHAVSELGAEDTSRNIIEIIFQSSWLKKQSPVCSVERILKVHNTARTLARFEEYRDAVKARAAAAAAARRDAVRARHPRCTADGNELLRFRCAALACPLGLHGATHLCDAACAACAAIRDGFKATDDGAGGRGIMTMATSGRAHDAVAGAGDGGDDERRAMLVCRVIAGRVKRTPDETATATAAAAAAEEEEEEYDSVAGSAGVYSNLEELQVFNPRAILPCFVVIYKA
ncbi:hypothetical protein ACP4OV_025913 [Aristida adscensionis]